MEWVSTAMRPLTHDTTGTGGAPPAKGMRPIVPPPLGTPATPVGSGAPTTSLRRGGPAVAWVSVMGWAAVAAGSAGFFGGPFLVGRPVLGYGVLVADLAAIICGALGIWGAWRGFTRLDLSIAGAVLGGASLLLWVTYMSSPPPAPAGGT